MNKNLKTGLALITAIIALWILTVLLKDFRYQVDFMQSQAWNFTNQIPYDYYESQTAINAQNCISDCYNRPENSDCKLDCSKPGSSADCGSKQRVCNSRCINECGKVKNKPLQRTSPLQ
jgi:hypothetical protein